MVEGPRSATPHRNLNALIEPWLGLVAGSEGVVGGDTQQHA